MKRASLAVCLLALATFSCQPALAQALGDTGGPITNQAARDAIAARVRAGASCAACDLFQIDLSYQNVGGRDFSGSRIRQAELSLTVADRAHFHRANLSLANLFGARLGGADLTGANLDNATLVGAYFGNAHFSGATLNGANLSGAEFKGATGLTQAQLNTACGDAMTQLPTGLTVPRC